MVCPGRLLDPTGFQDAMRDVLVDLVSAPINALVEGWYAAATRVVDMITPECLLHFQAHSASWYNQQLQLMKWSRRRLETIQKWAVTESQIR